jgi:hypothetical protein
LQPEEGSPAAIHSSHPTRRETAMPQDDIWLTWAEAGNLLATSKSTVTRLVKLRLLRTNGESRPKLRISGLSALEFFQQEKQEKIANKKIPLFIRKLMRGTPEENSALIDRRFAEIQRLQEQLRQVTVDLLNSSLQDGKITRQKSERLLQEFDQGAPLLQNIREKLYEKYVSK